MDTKFDAIEKSRELNQIQKEIEQATIKAEFNTWLEKTKHHILAIIAKNGKQQLSAKDNNGNTIINFTTSVDLYNFLREKETPFQFTQWLNHMTLTDALGVIANLTALGWGLSFVIAPQNTSTLSNAYLISLFGKIVSSGYSRQNKL